MRTIIEMARQAGIRDVICDGTKGCLGRFATFVRADERERITNLMLYMHNIAAPMHNYYKHAAIEINRKAGEGEKI